MDQDLDLDFRAQAGTLLEASKAMSAYGGSAEIQNNIIAERSPGLPDTTHPPRRPR